MTISVVAFIIAVLSILIIVAFMFAMGIRFILSRTEQLITNFTEEQSHLEEKIEGIIYTQESIAESISTITKSTDEARALKMKIDRRLQVLSNVIGVKSSSIMIPYPLSKNEKFVFLSIMGGQANKLKNTLIDIKKGIAGHVFENSESVRLNDVASDTRWDNGLDERISIKTKNLLCLPLRYSGKTIGVVQFINKERGFTEKDVNAASRYTPRLAHQVYEFAQKTSNFDILDLAYKREISQGTVLVVDLANLPSFFEKASDIPTTDMVNLINDYLEALTLIGVLHGGVVDKLLWGGFFMTFNVSRQVHDHRMTAVRAAFEMNEQFETLKTSWQGNGYPVNNIFNRIAVASGGVMEVSMGPAQYRQRTVIGDPVVVASTLCTLAPRDRNAITVDPSVYEDLSTLNIKSNRINSHEIGKTNGLVKEAYRLEL